MLISIVRHGETTWNALKKIQGQADPPMNEDGIAQAMKLAEEMGDLISLYQCIFSSNRDRAKMTAELLRGNYRIPIFFDSLLDSRNVGIFSGMTLEEIEEQYPEHYRKWVSGDPEFCPPGGESTRDLAKRCKDFVYFIKKKYPEDSKILVVTHRENLALLTYYITGERIQDFLRKIQNCTLYTYNLKKE